MSGILYNGNGKTLAYLLHIYSKSLLTWDSLNMMGFCINRTGSAQVRPDWASHSGKY